MMNMRNYILSLTLFLVGWVIGFAIFYFILSRSQCAQAYGLISGWWCALYISRICRLRISIAAGAFLGYLIYALFAVIFDFVSFYHDLPSKIDLPYITSAVLSAVIFASPLVIDNIISKLNKTFFESSS